MTPSFDRPFTFDRVMRILFSIIIIGGLILLITALRTALIPFLVAWLIAYILQPFVQFFQYKLKFKNRILSVMAVLLSFFIILSLLVWSIIPSISDEIAKTISLFNTHSANSTHIPFIPDSWLIALQENFKLNEFTQYFNKENLLKGVKQLAPQVWSMLSNTLSWLLSITILFVTLLYIVFILLDYEKIANGWLKLMPAKYRPFISTLAGDVESNMKRYFRGQTAIALIVGVLLAIGFKIISFPLAVSLGLFIGFLNLIPYMQTIGVIPMLVLSLLKSAETGDNFWVIFGSSLLVLAIVQVVQDLILTPRIMGKAMGLNPAIILLALSIWGSLLGFIGLIIALPLTTLVLSYYKRFVLGEESNKVLNKQEIIQEDER